MKRHHIAGHVAVIVTVIVLVLGTLGGCTIRRTQWEYQLLGLGYTVGEDDTHYFERIRTSLNQLGQEGWDCTPYPFVAFSGGGYMYCKRPR